jgi:signal transduction histidine kinase/ActR/RegA family two-component response regulator/CHASE3 domain sensor protein
MALGNTSIRRRIYFGFAVVLALLAIEVAVALRGLHRIRDLRQEIADRYDPPSQASQDLEHGVLHRAIAVRNFMLTRDRRHQHEYERLLATYVDRLEDIERMPLDAESRAALDAVAIASRVHISRTTSLLSLFGGRRPAAELADAEVRLADAREDLLARIRAFDDVQRTRQTEARARMSAAEREVAAALLGSAVLAALALGVTALLTSRAVRRPALALVGAARALEKGDYAPALALATRGRVARGELQHLAGAFARMAEALRRREQRSQAEGRLAAALARSLCPETTATSAIDEIAAYTGAEVAAVYLVEGPELRRVAGRAAEGTPPALERTGIVAEALAAGHPIQLADVPGDLPFVLHAGFGTVRPRAVLAVPLGSRGEQVGLLLLGSLRRMSEDAVAFALGAATSVAIALQNAESHVRIGEFAAELRDRNQQLQAQNEEIQAQTEELVAQGDEIRRHNDELGAAKEALAAKAAALEEVDRRKNEFLATLGHELRNPLAAVATAGSLLEAEARDGRVLRRAGVIARQVRNLRRLVDDLLDLSRINHGKVELRRESTDVAAAIEGAVHSMRGDADAKGQTIAFRCGADALHVDADPVRLDQVISNLLRNAIKYTPERGTITVAAGADGGEAVIRVGDTGMGISPDLLPRIFEPFIQGTHSEGGEQGLGLGLALVRRLVELHGGTVAALSEGEGTGTVFVVRLPLVAALAAPERPPLDPAAPERAEVARVLLVEDDPDVAATTAEALEMFGFEVRVESDADAGLRACTESPPDVALLDIGLPGRSGHELARDIRARLSRSEVRLVAVTGYGLPEDRARSRAAGFDHHLVKPVNLDELRHLIERLAAEGRSGVGAAA